MELTVETNDTEIWRRLKGLPDPIRLRNFTVALELEEVSQEVHCDIEFVANNDKPSIEATNHGIRISGSASYWGAGERLACCVLQLFDQRRLRRGGLCFHGVALAYRGRAVLLTGPSESGKTSAALSLLRRSARSVSMLSNDHILGQITEGGEIYLTPNPDVNVALRSHALWLADRDFYEILVGDQSDLVRHRRLRLPAVSLGAAPQTNDLVPLKAVVFVGVGTAADLLAYPTPTLRAATSLNADLSGRVRAGSLIPLEDDGALGPRLPDLTDDEIENTIDATIRSLVEHERIFDVRGPLDDVVDHIMTLLEVK